MSWLLAVSGTLLMVFPDRGRIGGASGLGFGLKDQTLESQWWYFGVLPDTASKKAFWGWVVTGPRAPAPIWRPSISRIGVTSAAVPVKKASSAMYRSSRVSRRDSTRRPRSAAIWWMDARVIPVRAQAMSGS